MFGAILGDIIGSAKEWNGIKNETFELFDLASEFTDDSVLTIATADAILHNKDFGECYYKWGNRYPEAGYGLVFDNWLMSETPQPYESLGNGSAMRVSPCGWVAKSLNEALKLAEESALPTHNHQEGINGAKAVAAAIFMARNKASKDEIKNFIEKNYGYNLHRGIEQIRPAYEFDSTCQGSVPEAIICFLESKSYEDAVRKAVSLGGDADTQACIAGSIAEAYYGIPQELVSQLYLYLPEDLMAILLEFQEKYMIK